MRNNEDIESLEDEMPSREQQLSYLDEGEGEEEDGKYELSLSMQLNN